MTYTKYSASGNDFVIFHTFITQDYSKLAQQLCNRQEGIGADGLIVLVPHNEHDFKWLFYNKDGSNADMCGNGTRACAHYAVDNGLALNQLTFLTNAGEISCTVDKDIVQTQMTPAKIIKEEFEQHGYTWHIIDTGVPHLVTIVDDLNTYDKTLASKMRHEHNANVNFAKIVDGEIFVRTYERGVEDETLACGTGLIACFLRAHNLNLVEKETFVYPKSNEQLTVTKTDTTVLFKGKVRKVFQTCI
ncbi:MAG: diaminopimelate epimerase [Campylobacterota bacterium]|nr:diaminopimelate epimerase [Campylobacterota bacterium]